MSAPAATNLFLSGQILHSVFTVQALTLPEFMFCSCSYQHLQRGTPSAFLRSFPLPGCVQKLGSYFICCIWRTDLWEEAGCGWNRVFINLPNKSSPAPVPFQQHLPDLQPVQPLLSSEVGNFLSYHCFCFLASPTQSAACFHLLKTMWNQFVCI